MTAAWFCALGQSYAITPERHCSYRKTWGKFPLFHWLWKWAGNSTDVGPPVSWGALDAHYSAHNTHSTVCVTHLQFSYTKPLWDRNISPWPSVTVTWPQPARDQENHHEHEPYEHSFILYRQKNCIMIHWSKTSVSWTAFLDIIGSFPVVKYWWL